MARTKKKYSTHTRQPGIAHKMRGGNPGKAVDSGFGATGNLHRTKKNYRNVVSNSPWLFQSGW